MKAITVPTLNEIVSDEHVLLVIFFLVGFVVGYLVCGFHMMGGIT